RCLQPDRLRRADIAVGRSLGDRLWHNPRLADRHGQRLRGRADRYGRTALYGCVTGVTAVRAVVSRGGGRGAEPLEHRLGVIDRYFTGCRPDHSRQYALCEDGVVHRGGAVSRLPARPHPASACTAKRLRLYPGDRLDYDRRRDPGGGRAELPRAGRATANAVLGRHAGQFGPALLRNAAVAGVVPRPRDYDYRAGVQPARRYPARCARSPTARTLRS